jgi:adenine deaminase
MMNEDDVEKLRERIRAARREIPSDLVLKKGRVVNVFSGTVEECDVAVHQGYVAGLGLNYDGKEVVDVKGKWVVPGFMDAHIHIESSMLLPSSLASALLPHGTTALVADPHEIANVMGIEGIRFMLRESEGLPLDIFFMAPSCVPASPFETSGAQLKAKDLQPLKAEKRILGLGELMNYPRVLMGDGEVLEKVALFQDRIIDGHGPSLTGYDLQAYLSAGIKSDHETSYRNEGFEKMKGGMMVMIREGTSAKNLQELLSLVQPANSRRFCFVSDDLHPQDILEKGHLDATLKKAVALGLDPVTAVQLVTLNPAEHFGLDDRGAVGPGFRADLVVLDNLEGFAVNKVYKDGRLRVDGGALVESLPKARPSIPSWPLKIHSMAPEQLQIPGKDAEARVIELLPGLILTKARIEKVRVANGQVVCDTGADILKLAVVERHRGSGRIGLGLVRGFRLKRGALASTVAHDSHNVIAVGVDDRDICLAVEELESMGGGMVVTASGEVLAKTPLEIAGLMSGEDLRTLGSRLRELNHAAAQLGCSIPEPFMALSFLALPVIPELKLTDLGLVDVNRFSIVPLFVEPE